jgi:hypothetical protein
MKVTQLYPDKWLSAAHLQGRTVTVTVETSTVEQLYNPRTKTKEAKFVLSFYKKQLRMVLNKTQAETMVTVTGCDDSDGWIGHQIAISPARTPGGQDTILISRPPTPPAAPSAPAPEPVAQPETPEEREDRETWQ